MSNVTYLVCVKVPWKHRYGKGWKKCRNHVSIGIKILNQLFDNIESIPNYIFREKSGYGTK